MKGDQVTLEHRSCEPSRYEAWVAPKTLVLKYRYTVKQS